MLHVEGRVVGQGKLKGVVPFGFGQDAIERWGSSCGDTETVDTFAHGGQDSSDKQNPSNEPRTSTPRNCLLRPYTQEYAEPRSPDISPIRHIRADALSSLAARSRVRPFVGEAGGSEEGEQVAGPGGTLGGVRPDRVDPVEEVRVPVLAPRDAMSKCSDGASYRATTAPIYSSDRWQ